jgi:PD-(D/E)XK endonuclease
MTEFIGPAKGILSDGYENVCSMKSTNTKGNVAEFEIATAALRLGIPVLKPLTEHGRCDLALEIGGRLWRIQCKWGQTR